MREDSTNRHEPVRDNASETLAYPSLELLTVSQAYDYLISEGLPRSKKTIRKWCRHNHVDWKEIAVPGGAKWLITRTSLDARIAEEKMIDASLGREAGANPSEPDRSKTGANPSVPAREDALIDVLREQLVHEREARRAAEAQSRELVDKYHEISMASAQMGIEIGKGMQDQAMARRLAVRSESDIERPIEISTGTRVQDVQSPDRPDGDGLPGTENRNVNVDYSDREPGGHGL